MSGKPTSHLPPLVRRDPTEQEELRQLWSMTRSQRVTAMRARRLSALQCAAWASRCPHEVPRLNGEFEFIAMLMPEVADGG